MTQPQKFTKLPVTIEAMRWDGTAEGATPIIDWILAGGGSASYRCVDPDECLASSSDCEAERADHVIAIQTLEGTMKASPGDWIIRGIKGEFYPCKPDIFAETYADGSPEAAFDRWLAQGIETGWADAVCETHDQVPWTRAEAAAFEAGSDPCIRAMRIWGPGGQAGVEAEQLSWGEPSGA